MNRQSAKISYSQIVRQEKDNRERKLVLRVIAGLIVVLALAVVMTIYVKQENEMQRLAKRRAQLEQELKIVQYESDEINSLKSISGTDEFIERIARDELGLVGPDEYIFQE